jgi:serine phosphatase RsbU (regulator of sigma subunit)
MELKIAVAKVDKYGFGKSGDTVEVTERPHGGLSIVLADGQVDHEDQKSISNLVIHRVIDQIVAGVRDGAAIRATSDSIFTDHNGRIQANLNVLSVDLQTKTIQISRNSLAPVFLVRDDAVDCLQSDSEPIGGRLGIKPTIVVLEIQPEVAVIVFSDGVYHAGRDDRQKPNICTIIETLFEEQAPTAQEIADFLLHRAIRLDGGHPKDDMSVLVLLVTSNETDQIRRMSVSMALDDIRSADD